MRSFSARPLNSLSLLLSLSLSPPPHHSTPKTDDSLAIIAAFASPELEIIGLTTTFGNVHTPTATKNALVLIDLLGVRVPVAQGSCGPLDGGGRPHLKVASFVHGEDGLGNTEEERRRKRLGGEGGDGDGVFSPDPRSAAEFIADSAKSFPGEVSVLALGPLTNVAEALMLLGRREREKEEEEGRRAPSSSADAPPLSQQQSHGGHQLHNAHPACSPAAASLLSEVVALGGAFFRNGNVTPAAEANILADPAAADSVLSTPGLPVRMVGLDVTHSCRMTASELESLRGKELFHFSCFVLREERERKGYRKKENSLSFSLFLLPSFSLFGTKTGKGSRVGGFAADISRFYLQYHAGAYAMPDSIFLHDPTALAAVVAPHLFTWFEGPVVVCVGKEENDASASSGVGDGRSDSSGLCGFSNPLRGMTVIDQGEKRWAAQKNSTANAWVGRPPARVAVGCDNKGVLRLVLDRLTDAAVAGGG